MPDVNINGQPTPNTGNASSDGRIFSPMTSAVGRATSNGLRPISITAIRLWAAGFGGTKSMRMFANFNGFETYTPYFDIPAAGSAYDVGFHNLADWFNIENTGAGGYGGNMGMDVSGQAYYGRAVGGSGVYVNGSLLYPGNTLAGTYRYVQVPTAPQSFALTDMGDGVLRITFTAPADNGGTPITAYRIQIANNAAFTSGLINITTTSGTYNRSLTPGNTYYVRVFARNAVTDMWSLLGPSTAVLSKTLEDTAIGFIRSSGAWVDAEGLIRSAGAWVEAEGLIYSSGAWVPTGT